MVLLQDAKHDSKRASPTKRRAAYPPDASPARRRARVARGHASARVRSGERMYLLICFESQLPHKIVNLLFTITS